MRVPVHNQVFQTITKIELEQWLGDSEDDPEYLCQLILELALGHYKTEELIQDVRDYIDQ